MLPRVLTRCCLFIAASLLPCSATILGDVRGVVHDPQHHPISGARTTLESTNSAYKLTGDTNADGIFQFSGSASGRVQGDGRSARIRRRGPGADAGSGQRAGVALSARVGGSARECGRDRVARGPES